MLICAFLLIPLLAHMIPLQPRTILATQLLTSLATVQKLLILNTVISSNDLQEAKEVIESGRVYVKRNWLSINEINDLRAEVASLELRQAFKPSGLSNRCASIHIPSFYTLHLIPSFQ